MLMVEVTSGIDGKPIAVMSLAKYLRLPMRIVANTHARLFEATPAAWSTDEGR